MVKKVIFTFSNNNLEILHKISQEGGFDDLTETINEGLKILRCLQQQAKEGYSEILVINPDTNETRNIISDHLKKLAPKKEIPLLPAPKPES